MRSPRCRRARLGDLDTLLELERDFPGDRLSRRSFRRLLSRPSAEIWICETNATPSANAVLLHRRGSRSARLYSLVVAPSARRQGLAVKLIERIEAAAMRRGCERIYLEVRSDNAAAIDLYRKRGYEMTRGIVGFYEDGCDALRLERRLAKSSRRRRLAA